MMSDLSMHEVLNQFDAVCECFARKFSPDLSDEDIDHVRHEVSIRLFDVVAEVSGQSTQSLFEGMRLLIDLEEQQ